MFATSSVTVSVRVTFSRVAVFFFGVEMLDLGHPVLGEDVVSQLVVGVGIAQSGNRTIKSPCAVRPTEYDVDWFVALVWLPSEAYASSFEGVGSFWPTGRAFDPPDSARVPPVID